MTQIRNLSPILLYHSYPGSNLIPIEPPTETETMREFAQRLDDCGDTLFLFLARELSDLAGDHREIVRSLEDAIKQIESVIHALRTSAPPDNIWEQRIRERRMEILMAGDGSEFMDEDEARAIAWSETLEEIFDMDGEHLAVTDPDLVEWYNTVLEEEDVPRQ